MLTLLRLETVYPDESVSEGGFPLPAGEASVCRLATGRSALYHLTKRLPKPHASVVLLPCYVAEGVIKPFLAAGFEVSFYPLNSDLRPDETAVERLFEQIEGRAVFVMVHYFGFSAASQSLLSLLADRDVCVISDCAHAPLSRSADGVLLGELGDVALYSLNKWLPVTDGAILVSRSPSISIAINEPELPDLPAAATDAFHQHLAACRALFSATDNVEATRKLETIGSSYEAYYELINNDLELHRQSDESRRIEAIFPYRTSARIRRRHAERLAEEINSPIFEPVYATLPVGIVPFCFPVLVPASRRKELQDTLFERGILLSTLDDKWDFVPTKQAENFPIETAFLRQHLLIPVNEFLSDSDISTIISELNTIR